MSITDVMTTLIYCYCDAITFVVITLVYHYWQNNTALLMVVMTTQAH